MAPNTFPLAFYGEQLKDPTMSDKLVIALLGNAGTGKTTTAKILRSFYGARIMSFAKPLKEIAGDLFQLNAAQLYGELKEVPDARYDKTPREILQKLGASMRSRLGEDVWVDAAISRMQSYKGVIVIDDCRYPNEAKKIQNLPCSMVIKLICRDSDSKADMSHQSECFVDEADFDHVIKNSIEAGRKSLVQTIMLDETFVPTIERFLTNDRKI